MDDYESRRAAAVARVKAKREFRRNVLLYLITNAFLVVVWAMSGAGYFWPIWPIAGWAVGLAFQAWNVYGSKPISDEEIQREMDSGQ